MALSKNAREVLVVALANKKLATEVADRADRQAANVPAITTANATDLASAEALANANKAAVNAIIAALQAAGLMS